MALDPASRLFTCDASLMTIAEATADFSTFLGGVDFLGKYMNSSLELNFDLVDAFVPHDTVDPAILGFRKRRKRKKTWTLTLGNVVESSIGFPTLLAYSMGIVPSSGADVAALSNKVRGLVQVSMFRPGVAGATAYSGKGWLSCRVTINRDSATEMVGTVNGYGPLVIG